MMIERPQGEELALARTLKRLAEDEATSLKHLFRLLAIPSISTDPHHHDGLPCGG